VAEKSMKSGDFNGRATRRENFYAPSGGKSESQLQMGKFGRAGTRKKFAARGGGGEERRQKAECGSPDAEADSRNSEAQKKGWEAPGTGKAEL